MVVVPWTRLSRTARRWSGVHGRLPSPTPARWTTTSAPVSAAASTVPACGSHLASSGAAGGRRTSRTTWWPSLRNDAARAGPSRPEAPVRTTFTCSLLPGRPRSMRPGPTGSPARRPRRPSEAEVGLERPVLESGLHGAEEPRRVGAVDQPVVVRQRQVAHRADGDRLAEVRVVHDHGALDDGAGAEDADLRLVDDRCVEERATAAGVGQGEGAATQLVRRDLVAAGALREVGDLAGQPGDVEVAGVLDHRDQQAALGVDRDAEVLGAVVG